jgi:hypothetical protein
MAKRLTPTPKEGERWINYKTKDTYTIICIAQSAWDITQRMVIYQNVEDSFYWVRSMQEFTEKFYKEGYINGEIPFELTVGNEYWQTDAERIVEIVYISMSVIRGMEGQMLISYSPTGIEELLTATSEQFRVNFQPYSK